MIDNKEHQRKQLSNNYQFHSVAELATVAKKRFVLVSAQLGNLYTRIARLAVLNGISRRTRACIEIVTD